MNAPRGRPRSTSKSARQHTATHLTLRNVPTEVMIKLAHEARRLGASRNATAVWLLRRGLGLGEEPYDNGLGKYAGDWSQDDFDDFTRATAPFERIDEELWR